MKILYTLGVNMYVIFVRIASLWNKKAKNWIQGRKSVWKEIDNFKPGENVYWFHCASLGEFEQGRPVMEALKKQGDCQIVISFFSPSGYNIRKNYELADLVVYLPKDSSGNAKRFIDSIKPKKIFFIKYEIWANYILEAKSRKIPLYLISAVFRKEQPYFKWYGAFFKKLLRCFDDIFVQDKMSQNLLKELDIESKLAGDTRYDRVMANARSVKPIQEIDSFVSNRKVLVCGSVWDLDMKVISHQLNSLDDDWVVIIAPHEIGKKNIDLVRNYLKKDTVLYSKIGDKKKESILIIDNIGMLMNVYQYADLAYMGGAFKTGLHNILEPASFGVPVIFGPHYSKFPEAELFINNKIGFSISNENQFQSIFAELSQKDLRSEVQNFMESQKGATELIMQNS